MSSKLTPQESIDLLIALLSCYEFVECLDKVTELSVYRHELKQKVKAVMPELEKFAEPLKSLFGCDDEALFDIMENKKQLMKKISTLRPENMSGLNQVLETFFQAPELTIHRLGIKVIKKDKSAV